MSITKKVLDWNENKLDKLLTEDLNVKNGIKIFGHGFIEGVIDTATIIGGSIIVAGYAIIAINKIKK